MKPTRVALIGMVLLLAVILTTPSALGQEKSESSKKRIPGIFS
jgi:hypothetical protein